MLIPKPFSKVLLLAGSPIDVPSDATRTEITEITEGIQQEMDRIDLLGQRIIRGDESAMQYVAERGHYPNDEVGLGEDQEKLIKPRQSQPDSQQAA